MPTEEGIVAELGRVLDPSRVLGGGAALRAYDCDAYTIDRRKPTAIVLPESTEEVQAVVKWCAEHDTPFTPRGAGTGLSGGSMPAAGGVVISTKRMNRVLDFDVTDRWLHAQAGAPNIQLTRAVEGYGLHFAPDPSSQAVSTVGGNVAENSGGPHTLKYGVTAQHTLKVKIVFPNGEVEEVGSLVEGAPGVDLLGVIVGSEGTVGIVTEVWVRLTPIPQSVETLLASFPTVRSAGEAVAAIIAKGVLPAALEMLDRNVMDAVSQAFELRYPSDANALLLVECDGWEDAPLVEIDCVEDICCEKGALSIEIARDDADRARLWQARKKGIGAMGRLAPTIVTHDGVIPRSRLPEMLDYVYAVAVEHSLGVGNMFHAGDGNLHPIFFFDDREPGVIERVIAAGEQVVRKCIELGGSATGEHGIGVEKLSLMPLMFDEPSLRLQNDVKAIFHESELCNPCKLVPDQKGCVEHMRRWRGAAT